MKTEFVCRRLLLPVFILCGCLYFVFSSCWFEKSFRHVPFDSAGNATLGFEKVIYVNLPYREDYANVMTLQSHLTGLEYIKSDGVDYHDFKPGYKGLPPLVNKELPAAVIGCAMSHINAWKQVVAEDWSSVLILESDATWDENIKEIAKRAAEGLHKLLTEKQLHRSRSNPTHSDPYDAAQWDILSWGTCFDEGGYEARDSEVYVTYSDTDSPDCVYDWPGNGVREDLIDERVMRKSGFPFCSSAYALTRKGAEKLLLRSSLFIDGPIDVTIAQEIDKEHLIGYEMFPPPFYQWRYVEGIGAEGLNSDIASGDGQKDNEDSSMDRWNQIQESSLAWRIDDWKYPWPYKKWVMEGFASKFLPANLFFR